MAICYMQREICSAILFLQFDPLFHFSRYAQADEMKTNLLVNMLTLYLRVGVFSYTRDIVKKHKQGIK